MNEEGTPTAKQIRKDEQAKQVQSPDTDMMSQWPRILTGLLIADINVILN